MQSGVIVEYHREYCWVKLACGETVVAKLRSHLEFEQAAAEQDHAKDGRPVFARRIVVGDQVDLEEAQPGHFVIERIHQRETWLIRKGTKRYLRRFQLVVANADQLMVVVAAPPLFNLNAVDRYFLAAIQGGLEPLLVVNKVDLDPALRDSLEVRTYRDLGYRVFFTSATQREGLDALAASLGGKLTVFCGQSGVGKSTLLACLTGEEIEVGEVNLQTQKGRQTTTTAKMYFYGKDAQLVDTPGVRVFGLAHLTWLDVHEYFADIAKLTQGCAYRNCLHKPEPDCAVRSAVREGKLSVRRLDSYIKLRDESDSKYWE